MKNKQLYVEIVKEWITDSVPLMSTPRKATKLEIEKSRKLHKQGKCPPCGKGAVFYDEAMYMYDHRRCGICDRLIGLI